MFLDRQHASILFTNQVGVTSWCPNLQKNGGSYNVMGMTSWTTSHSRSYTLKKCCYIFAHGVTTATDFIVIYKNMGQLRKCLCGFQAGLLGKIMTTHMKINCKNCANLQCFLQTDSCFFGEIFARLFILWISQNSNENYLYEFSWNLYIK